MNSEQVIKSSQEQAAAAWVTYINHQRITELIQKLSAQDVSLEKALAELQKLKDFIGDPAHILGSSSTKHGEIAENVQVYFSNARRFVEGLFAEYSFDGGRILFFFTADGRIDFRELVKDLAAHFHTRIELRQIGVRDEAKMLGGIGICGQPYCCKQFLNDFQTVSIKMAKEQGLSLNPTKVSGSCGRLMCCLKYEQDSYEQLRAMTPAVGAVVKTPEGLATVVDVNLVTGNLLVRLNDTDGIPFKIHRDDVKPARNKHRREEK